ncbi:hypothetical protein [Sulfuriroseicoccus oceanibius]|uniref:Uncharacterized protein n=1 Tax=Sulfuriroseicoccus oceanibius TaxID=2707525 RepID=A0A6B3L9E0_9BACT|nr:hypothetical protein [Sulfuriroseicoccus oceanibius]QQL45035.1 hypothetical protein G3M56_000150 [Sulfuriroseicoccus oceanibius]
MKIHPRIVIGLLLGWCAIGHADDEERALQGARVTLPLDAFALEMAKAAREADAANAEDEPTLPVGAVVRSACYTVDFGAEAGNAGRVEVAVRSLQDAPQLVPILNAGYAITRVAPDEATLVTRDGRICLVVEGRGDHNVQIDFALDVQTNETLALDVHPANRVRLQLENLEDGKLAKVRGAVDAGGGGFLLPAEGGEVAVVLVDDRPDVAPEWSARASAVVVEEEGDLQVAMVLRMNLANPDEADADSAVLLLPAGALVQDLFGAGLVNWQRFGMRDGMRMVRLQWAADGAASRKVSVGYSLPLDPDGNGWSWQWPQLEGGLEVPVVASVLTDAAVDVTSVEGVRDWGMDAELPDWYQRPVSAQVQRIRVESNAGEEVELEWVERERLQTAEAVIRKSEMSTKVAVNGGSLSEGQVTIAHDAPIRWRLELPAGSALLGCAVDGMRVDPLVNADGSLDVPVGTGKDGVSVVKYSFTSELEKLAPVDGRLELELPATPLFAHEMSWRLWLPPAYEATALEGNLEIVEGGGAGKWLVLSKQLFRDAAPKVSVFYRKASL